MQSLFALTLLGGRFLGEKKNIYILNSDRLPQFFESAIYVYRYILIGKNTTPLGIRLKPFAGPFWSPCFEKRNML